MTYKVFKPKSIRRSENSISITKNYGFNFLRQVSRKYLSAVDYVELYFDEDKNKIGICPKADKTENVYKLRGTKGKWIKARDFLEAYKCVHTETRKYIANWNESEKLLEIQL